MAIDVKLKPPRSVQTLTHFNSIHASNISPLGRKLQVLGLPLMTPVIHPGTTTDDNRCAKLPNDSFWKNVEDGMYPSLATIPVLISTCGCHSVTKVISKQPCKLHTFSLVVNVVI